MKSLSKIALAIQPSATLAVDSRAKEMRARGLNVLNFGIGEPDFNTPEAIQEAGIQAIRQGRTKYTPAAGVPELRSAAALRIKQDFGVDYDSKQIVIASGAKHVLFVAFEVLVNCGDEIILPAPYWVSYYEMIRMAGGIPVIVNAPESQHFKITPEQLEQNITEKTKAFVLNNPSNPTGMVYNRAELKALAEVCRKHDIYVVSDEIYSNLIYDNVEFTSFAAISPDAKQRTIVVNGVSKSYAMTGWRIGYAAANPEIAKAMSSYLSHSTGAPGTMCQYAAAEAFSGSQETVAKMRNAFDNRRKYLVERINSIANVSCLRPQGAFYVMLNLEKLIGRTLGGKLIRNDSDFAEAFLEKSLVAVTPCVGFGMPNFVRWSYAAGMEQIAEGTERLEEFLKN
jgi:aspartate aminotransferase